MQEDFDDALDCLVARSLTLGLPLSREAEGDWFFAFVFIFPIAAD